MKWLLEWMFPALRGRAVKISRDHLPGLLPPKAAPFTPKKSKPEVFEPWPSVDEWYKRFKASGSASKKRKKRDDGMNF
jgi:hypothetical protein